MVTINFRKISPLPKQNKAEKGEKKKYVLTKLHALHVLQSCIWKTNTETEKEG